jgi:hypothetical protein
LPVVEWCVSPSRRILLYENTLVCQYTEAFWCLALDNNILQTLVGGYFLTGAEQKAPNEPVRGLYDALKPKLHYAYDRYADAYLPMPT